MKKMLVTSALLLFTASSPAAPTPASGELNDSDRSLSFSGGPFTVPNPTSDGFYLGGSEPEDTPVLCNAALMNCDVYALTLAIPEDLRSAGNAAVRVVARFEPDASTADLTSFDIYLHDASGKKLVRSEADFAGADHSTGFELPLDALPNGAYELRVTANRGFGASYTADVDLVQSTARSASATAAGGALSPLLLALAFPAFAARLRR